MSHQKKRNSSFMSNDSEQLEKIGDYIIKQSIREGTFGKIKIGIHKYTGVKAAIKILINRD